MNLLHDIHDLNAQRVNLFIGKTGLPHFKEFLKVDALARHYNIRHRLRVDLEFFKLIQICAIFITFCDDKLTKGIYLRSLSKPSRILCLLFIYNIWLYLSIYFFIKVKSTFLDFNHERSRCIVKEINHRIHLSTLALLDKFFNPKSFGQYLSNKLIVHYRDFFYKEWQLRQLFDEACIILRPMPCMLFLLHLYHFYVIC